MVEETKAKNTNIKTQLSLAAALFFSPLVAHELKKNTRDLRDDEKTFIRGYIRLGYIILLFGGIVAASSVMEYFFPIKALNTIYIVSISLLVFLLVISIVSILSDISLLRGEGYTDQTYAIEGNKKDIILTYLPIYNIYLRYRLHNFQKPNRRLKESLIVRSVFIVVCFIGSIPMNSIILLLIIMRIASIMSDIDTLPFKVKQRGNALFLKNPEEIRGYITGTIRYLIISLIHLFVPVVPYHLGQEITKEKMNYEHIIDIHTPRLIAEYILGILLMASIPILIPIDFSVRTYYTGLVLIIMRYIVMAIHIKHLPHLPIAREIILLIKNAKKLFIRNPYSHELP